MSDSQEPVRPEGVRIVITDTHQVALKFDHGETPPVILTPDGAEQVGGQLTSASNRARGRVDDYSHADGGDLE